MAAPLPSFRNSGLGRLFLAPAAAEVFAGLLVDLTHAQLDLAAVVKAQDLDLDRIADLDHVRCFADSLLRQLADVDEAVLGAEEVHEGAEIDDLDHLAIV